MGYTQQILAIDGKKIYCQFNKIITIIFNITNILMLILD